jgi:hypothetical protein
MKLTIGPENITNFAGDKHLLYTQVMWELTIEHDEDLLPELLRNDIWTISTAWNNQQLRSTYNKTSEILNKFRTSFDQQIKQQILKRIWSSPPGDARMGEQLRNSWRFPLDYYIKKSHFTTIIIKDMPGFKMTPHLDNHHVMVQLIINLQDNCTSTKFYPFNSTNPFYVAPTNKYQGIMFLNKPGAVHDIDNITKDRYMLYAVINIDDN